VPVQHKTAFPAFQGVEQNEYVLLRFLLTRKRTTLAYTSLGASYGGESFEPLGWGNTIRTADERKDKMKCVPSKQQKKKIRAGG
jgi:hypothetical protein